MRIQDLYETSGSIQKTEFTSRYNKNKKSLSKSDKVLSKSIVELETLLAKGEKRPSEEDNKLQSYRPHAIPHIRSKKGKALLGPHQQEGFKLYQAHLNSQQKKGRFVMVYGVKGTTLRFVIVGTHDDTTGG
jgi:mRNA-degrading endonuclease YafQ of YafQ-DinJ toxin-antitoxin module